MKLRNQLLKYNLQYFADNNGNADQNEADNSGDDDGDDDQDDDDQDDNDADDKSKKSGKKGKFYSQEEIDEIITKRLERERKKLEKKQQSKDDKQSDKGSDDKREDESAKKLSELEMKVLCYDHDIAKEYVKEAIALAKAYVDEDTDMDDALEMVTKKFPQFVKGFSSKKKSEDDDDDEEEDDTDNKKSWGQRQKGQSKKIDPVEARFLERNPGLKID